MKLAILTSVVVIVNAGIALAGANNMTSGRPSAVLNDTQCQAIWTIASPSGATISKDQPYIVNFTMVDVDGDGNITADEFKAACGKGLVKNTQ